MLHIGDLTIVAIEFGLWSDPSVWEVSADLITVKWGGQNVRLLRHADGSWTAEVHLDLLRGKARFVP